MMLAAAVIPSTGVTSQLVPFLAGISYYATAENNWTEVLHLFIKSWLIPQDAQAIKYFYEGLPQGAPIPWNAWMVPLLAWASFMVARANRHSNRPKDPTRRHRTATPCHHGHSAAHSATLPCPPPGFGRGLA